MLAKFNQVVAFLIITSLIRFVTLMLQAYCGKINVIKNIYQNVFLTHLNDYSVNISNFQRSKLFFNIFYKKKTNVNFFSMSCNTWEVSAHNLYCILQLFSAKLNALSKGFLSWKHNVNQKCSKIKWLLLKLYLPTSLQRVYFHWECINILWRL